MTRDYLPLYVRYRTDATDRRCTFYKVVTCAQWGERAPIAAAAKKAGTQLGKLIAKYG